MRKKGKKSAVFDYFELSVDGEKPTATCKVDGCPSKQLSGHHASNLKAHLRNRHPLQHERVNSIDAEKNLQGKRSSESGEPAPKKQATIMEAFGQPSNLSKTISIQMDARTFEESCIKMITQAGCPFRIVESPGFSSIVNPIKRALGISMDKNVIRENILTKYATVARELKAMLENKLVFIKLDISTRMERTFLGVNVQFCHQSAIKIYALKVLELCNGATDSATLTTKLTGILEEFGIAPNQVVSITSDNGANVLKIAKILSANEEPEVDEDDIDDISDGDEIEDTLSDTDVTGIEIESSDELVFQNEPENEVQPIGIDINVESVRCAAHTLELAAGDVMKLPQVSRSLAVARGVVKKLRTKTLIPLALCRYGKKPILDNKTRWGSKFDMISRLEEMKEGLEEWGLSNPDLRIRANTWKVLEEIKSVLQPVRSSIRVLQTAKLTPGDFYRTWLQSKLQVKKLSSSPIARKLYERMEVRGKQLIGENKLMISAIYCDPRYACTLSAKNLKIAREHVIAIAVKLQAFDGNIQVDVSQEAQQHETEADDDDVVEAFLKEKDRIREHCENPTFVSRLKHAMDEYEAKPRLQLGDSGSESSKILMKWWSDNNSIPIADAAKVLMSLPSTQVSVERLFSAMAFFLSSFPYRCTLVCQQVMLNSSK